MKLYENPNHNGTTVWCRATGERVVYRNDTGRYYHLGCLPADPGLLQEAVTYDDNESAQLNFNRGCPACGQVFDRVEVPAGQALPPPPPTFNHFL